MAAAHATHSVAAANFSREDGARSLSEMAQRDLDAALQLLADRALYITGSTGAAIALRRQGRNDMLCRASTGTSAPALGSLLSTEIGLSGESVRTRRALLCQDVQRDVRVNRDVCRAMGIASVIVMPVVNDDQVLGVFEIFSGKVSAFNEHDLSALQRLSEMVETTVKLAQAAESIPAALAEAQQAVALAPVEDAKPVHSETATGSETKIAETKLAEAKPSEISEGKTQAAAAPLPANASAAVRPLAVATPAAQVSVPQVSVPVAAPPSFVSNTVSVPAKPQPAATLQSASAAYTAAPTKKPLFWTAAVSAGSSVAKSAATVESEHHSNVPPVLRKLHKCEACGFPVSPGRSLCVECEEKKWRGQLRRSTPLPAPPNPAIPPTASAPGAPAPEESAPVARLMAAAGKSSAAAATAPARAPEIEQGTFVADYPTAAAKPARTDARTAASVASAAPVVTKSVSATSARSSKPAAPELIFSAAIAPSQTLFSQSVSSQSWFSANKYILGALVVVAATVAAILLLR